VTVNSSHLTHLSVSEVMIAEYHHICVSVPNQDLYSLRHMSWCFCVQWFEVTGGCACCWHWWNVHHDCIKCVTARLVTSVICFIEFNNASVILDDHYMYMFNCLLTKLKFSISSSCSYNGELWPVLLSQLPCISYVIKLIMSTFLWRRKCEINR
jgi:hypothetical protein